MCRQVERCRASLVCQSVDLCAGVHKYWLSAQLLGDVSSTQLRHYRRSGSLVCTCLVPARSCDFCRTVSLCYGSAFALGAAALQFQASALPPAPAGLLYPIVKAAARVAWGRAHAILSQLVHCGKRADRCRRPPTGCAVAAVACRQCIALLCAASCRTLRVPPDSSDQATKMTITDKLPQQCPLLGL